MNLSQRELENIAALPDSGLGRFINIITGESVSLPNGNERDSPVMIRGEWNDPVEKAETNPS